MGRLVIAARAKDTTSPAWTEESVVALGVEPLLGPWQWLCIALASKMDAPDRSSVTCLLAESVGPLWSLSRCMDWWVPPSVTTAVLAVVSTLWTTPVSAWR